MSEQLQTKAEKAALYLLAKENQVLVGTILKGVPTMSRQMARLLDTIGLGKFVNESWIEVTEAGRAEVEYMEEQRLLRSVR